MQDLLWQPSATRHDLQERANLTAKIRDFFTNRQYLEVETPVMAHHGITDRYLSNVTAYCQHQSTYLQTSPEYHMKRLLAAGSGPIFQLARVFRDDELGRWHNPEFSLLEWYQLGIDHHELMQEVDSLLQLILSCSPLRRYRYQEIFLSICQLDPWVATLDELRALLVNYQLQHVLPADETDVDQYLFLLMTHVIEPALAGEGAPVAVYDFPPSQAALARINHDAAGGVSAARFEIYYQGVELANGFHELTDPIAQAQRFATDREQRQLQGLADVAVDPLLLAALSHGLPACSGVALGLDRLFALALQKTSIADVLAFDWRRA